MPQATTEQHLTPDGRLDLPVSTEVNEQVQELRAKMIQEDRSLNHDELRRIRQAIRINGFNPKSERTGYDMLSNAGYHYDDLDDLEF